MRTISQSKSIKKHYINLEPVEIDVQITQKPKPSTNKFELHHKAILDVKIAQSYDHILNQTIEDMLVSLSENQVPVLETLSKLLEIKKQKISSIAVFNLQIIQKLTYLLDRCQKFNINVDLQVIRGQINYWTTLIHFSLVEESKQIERYGLTNKKQIESINRDRDHRMQQQGVQELNSGSDSLEQKQPTKISKAPRRRERIEQISFGSIKPSKIPRNRYSSTGNKNGDLGANQNYFGNIDS